MAELGDNRKRFTSPINAFATTTAQQLLLKPAEWLYTRVHGWLGTSGEMPAVVPLLLLAIFVGHFAAACRRCYDGGWWRPLVQGIAAFVAFAAASMWVYRPAQFLLALWTM